MPARIRRTSGRRTLSSAKAAARPAGRLHVQGRRRRRCSTWARRRLDPQAGRLALLGAPPRRARVHRPGRLDRLPGHRDGGRGAARRAAVHQAPPAALQHPPARRQVLSLRRASASTRSSRASTSRASATAPGRVYFGPFSSARRVRETLDLLGKLFQYRTCEGPEPGPAVGGALPRLLHQALPGALRRLHRPRGVPAQHRGDHRLPLRPLPRRRARPGAQDGRGGRRRGVRAGGDLPRPPRGGPLADAAPQRRRRVAGDRRPDRRRRRRAAAPTPRSSRCATACSPSATASTSPTRASEARPR